MQRLFSFFPTVFPLWQKSIPISFRWFRLGRASNRYASSMDRHNPTVLRPVSEEPATNHGRVPKIEDRDTAGPTPFSLRKQSGATGGGERGEGEWRGRKRSAKRARRERWEKGRGEYGISRTCAFAYEDQSPSTPRRDSSTMLRSRRGRGIQCARNNRCTHRPRASL